MMVVVLFGPEIDRFSVVPAATSAAACLHSANKCGTKFGSRVEKKPQHKLLAEERGLASLPSPQRGSLLCVS